MKKFQYIGLLATALVVFSACDKVENPIKPAILLDTNLHDGNWEDYPWPTWTANTNTDRNVVIEDFTGHRCPNCPAAAYEAMMIEDANPGRVFVASIHASPTGLGNFQNTASDCGTITNPDDEFCTVFYCDEGIAYGTAFGSGFGFIGNPQGNINRISFEGSTMFQFKTEWVARVDEVLNANDLKVNIQAQSNYYPTTNGLFLHVETEFKQDLTGGSYNLVTYLIEDHAEDFQDSMSVIVEEYEHHNIFRGCLDGLEWGRPITGDYTTGAKSYYDYSYEFPAGTIKEDYHLLIYVYDLATYEILQVIKHEF
jgi:hypothetical protein